MKSETLGTNTSQVEVTQISKDGLWLMLRDKKHFLSFDHFPWFRTAPMAAVHNVKFLNEVHLYWPDLDIDLAVESIVQPEKYPLLARS